MSKPVLPDIPSSAIDSTEEVYGALVDLRNRLEELIPNEAIVDISSTAITVSGTYTQSEIQQIADNTKTVSDKVDTILAVLRNAGIVGE